MRLTLKVRSYCDQPPRDQQVRSFDSFPVIVGRSNACDYCLDDASRYISSNHALILLEGGQLLVQDTSANGVYLNGAAEPVGRGRNVILNNADSLAIGDYTLSVGIVNAASPAGAVDDPFADFDSGTSSQSSAAAPATYDPFRGDEPDWTPPSAQSSDPFANDLDIVDTPGRGRSDPATSSDGGWADWIDDADNSVDKPGSPPRQSDGAPQTSNDDDFSWIPGSSSETVSIPDSLPVSHKPLEPHRSRPQQAAKSIRQSTRASSNPPQDRANLNARAQHSPRVATTPSRNPSRQPPATPASGHSENVLTSLDAVLSAASLSKSDFAHLDDTEVLAQTGRLLAQMVDAMMVLLQSRTELKNAIHSDVTTLSRSGNNPLKFSFDAADALTKLLAHDTEGYMSADSAVKEAVDDLKLHQLAMLEGMKSAVKSLLLQFDPDKLARKLEKTGGISANFPITREAKLWELFCEQYDAIHEEAVNDFSELFGAEFQKAYENRVRKMGRNPDF